ncbi:hypothetical protein SH611_20370 [Geminicoccaceae bacterium 1502E]|nr:hypothetical protein [Geminicoccaceae bacterium 1502E]
MRRLTRALLAGALLVLPAAAGAAPADYPTEAVADYVFGCMATNGSTQDALRRCSCSIDHVAREVSWEDYVKAETVLRMRLVPSGNDQVTMFRTSPWAQEMVDRLRKAQIEAEFECF